MLLAIDTSLSSVSLCMMKENATESIAHKIVLMEKGHAEALLPLLRDLFSVNQIEKKSIRKIAVTVGPGSYTGMRIGIAAAKAMGVALNIPVVGVSTLAALAAPLLNIQETRPFAAVIDARNDHIYAQCFVNMKTHAPLMISKKTFFDRDNFNNIIFIGPAAKDMAFVAHAHQLSADYVAGYEICDIQYVARLGWLAHPDTAPPMPLYLNTPQYKKMAAV